MTSVAESPVSSMRPRSRRRLYALGVVLTILVVLYLPIRWRRIDEALKMAVLQHESARAASLLDSGANPSLRLESPGTPRPASSLDWVRAIFHIRPPIEGTGETLLAIAVQSGDVETVGALLNHGSDPNLRLANGSTAIMHVAGRRGLEIARLLIARHADVRAADSSGSTALHVAARDGQPDLIDALIAAGADVNAVTASGASVLVYAAGSGAADPPASTPVAVRELIGNPGRRKQQSIDLLLAHHARLPTKPPGLNYSQGFRSNIPWESLLGWAAESGSPALVRAAWEQTPPAQRATDGAWALRLSIMDHNRESVIFLVDRGVSISRGQNGGVGLLTAIQANDLDIMRILINRGAPVSLPDGSSSQPLLTAVEQTNVAAATLLLEHGARVNATDRRGQTALQLAMDEVERTDKVTARFLRVPATDDYHRGAAYQARIERAKARGMVAFLKSHGAHL